MRTRPVARRWAQSVPDVALGNVLTAPGTSLAVGETATLPLRAVKGEMERTLTAIERGDPGDLQSLEGTPSYVRLQASDRFSFENGEDYRIDGDTSGEWG